MSSREIADAAREGRTGLAPFDISPRTVRDIVAKMEADADRKLPVTVIELESAEQMERSAPRAARLVDAELGRIEAKVSKGTPLTDREVDLLPKLATYGERIAKLIESRQAQRRQGRAGTTQGAKRPETAVERLAREQGEQAGSEVQPCPAHTHRDDGAPPAGANGGQRPSPAQQPHTAPVGSQGATDATGAASRSDVTPPVSEAVAKTTIERAEAARNARAALARSGG